jgi:endonuclease/exonuclease/phosphatase family metal-dependent hydrolase
MRRLFVVSAVIASLALPVSAQAAEPQLTVMSRNLYLGADVGVALDLIPDFSAAAQFMWDQVAATDFTKRAPVLAAEVIANNADVVGLQEATHWYCKRNLWSKKVIVYDFTNQFLASTKAAGHEYVLASKNGVDAMNIGYSIPAIPYLTMVKDPSAFQPLFGTDSAACGFEIGDALVVKKELADKVKLVGNTEYDVSYSIVPKIMTIYRGYTWADLDYNGATVRVVTTHLESLWDTNKVPNAAKQADQLIEDLSASKMPVIVIGDFNSDPRDPRVDTKSNPGGQPEASESCPVQVAHPTLDTARDTCNPYWKMRKAGFVDSGPDPQNALNYTWGMSALLKGPDPVRLKAAQAMGNKYGFTDRLDYIFLKNGVTLQSSKIVGNTYPQGSVWKCGADICNDTDHASVVSVVTLPLSTLEDAPLPSHAPFPISFWNWVGIGLLATIGGFIYWRRRKR